MLLVVPLIAVVLLVALASAAAVWVWRSREELHLGREAWAARMGWTYRRHAKDPGLRFEIAGATSEGTPWTLSAWKVSGPGGAREETRWLAPVPREPAAAVVVGPTAPAGVRETALPARVEALFGAEAAQLGALAPVQVGPDAFRARFEVLATDADLAEQFVSDPTVVVLLDWTDAQTSAGTGDIPIVLYWRPGLEIRVRRIVEHPGELARIVELGLMLHTTIIPG